MKRAVTLGLALFLLGLAFPTATQAQMYYGQVIYVGQTTADLYTGPFNPSFTKVEFMVKGKVIGTIDNLTNPNGVILTARNMTVGSTYLFEWKAYLASGSAIQGTCMNGYVRAGEIAGMLFRPDTMNKKSFFVDSTWIYPGGRMVFTTGADVGDTLGLGSEEPRLIVYASDDPSVVPHGILEANGGMLRHILVDCSGTAGPFTNFRIIGADLYLRGPDPVIMRNCFVDRYASDDIAYIGQTAKNLEAYGCTFLGETELNGVSIMRKCIVGMGSNVYANDVDSTEFSESAQLSLSPKDVPSRVENSTFKTYANLRFTNGSTVQYNAFDPTTLLFISPLADGFDPANVGNVRVHFNDFQRDPGGAATMSNNGADSIDATRNWWGKCSGPDPADVRGNIKYKPYLRTKLPGASYWLDVVGDKDIIVANDDDEVTFTGHVYNSLTGTDTAGVEVAYAVIVAGDSIYKGILVTDATGGFTFKFKMPSQYSLNGTAQVFFTAMQCISEAFIVSISEQSGPDLEIVDMRVMQVQGSATDIVAGKYFAVKLTIQNTEPITTPFGLQVQVNNAVYDTFYVENKAYLGLNWNFETPLTRYTMPKLDAPTLVVFVNDPTIIKGDLKVKAIVDPPDPTHPKGLVQEASESNNTWETTLKARIPAYGPEGTPTAKVFIQPVDNFPLNRIDRVRTWSDSARVFMEKAWPMLPGQMNMSYNQDVLQSTFINPDSLLKETWEWFLMKSYKLMRTANPAFDRYVFAVAPNWFRSRLSYINFDHRSTAMLNWSGILDLSISSIEHHKYLVHLLGHTYGLRRGDLDTLNQEEYIAFYSLGKEVSDGIDADLRRLMNYGQHNKASQVQKVHCFMGGSKLGNTFMNWICDDDYNQLLQSFSSFTGGKRGQFAKAVVPKAMLVEGSVDRASGNFSFGPWVRLNDATPSIMCPDQFATHTFRVLDASNVEIAKYLYKPTFKSQGFDEDGEESTPIMDTEYFAFVVPWPDNAKKLVVEKDGNVLLERTPTSGAPVVSIISPAEGGVVNPADGVTAQWSASDADGETEFFYTVYFSSDGGATWKLIQYEKTSTEFLIPRAWLAAGMGLNKIKVIASDGTNVSERIHSFSITGAENVPHPAALTLLQNYPNPFNPSTTIAFELPTAGHATIEIFDAFGRHVETLVDGTLPGGYHTVEFQATNQPSGTYIAVLRSGDARRTIRMTLTK